MSKSENIILVLSFAYEHYFYHLIFDRMVHTDNDSMNIVYNK